MRITVLQGTSAGDIRLLVALVTLLRSCSSFLAHLPRASGISSSSQARDRVAQATIHLVIYRVCHFQIRCNYQADCSDHQTTEAGSESCMQELGGPLKVEDQSSGRGAHVGCYCDSVVRLDGQAEGMLGYYTKGTPCSLCVSISVCAWICERSGLSHSNFSINWLDYHVLDPGAVRWRGIVFTKFCFRTSCGFLAFCRVRFDNSFLLGGSDALRP